MEWWGGEVVEWWGGGVVQWWESNEAVGKYHTGNWENATVYLSLKFIMSQFHCL